MLPVITQPNLQNAIELSPALQYLSDRGYFLEVLTPPVQDSKLGMKLTIRATTQVGDAGQVEVLMKPNADGTTAARFSASHSAHRSWNNDFSLTEFKQNILHTEILAGKP